MADLDRIQGEISIGCNKCYQFYPHTQWRPTFWTLVDTSIALQRCDEFREWDNLGTAIKVVPSYLKPICPTLGDAIHVEQHGLPEGKFGFSRNLVWGMHGGWTVIHLSLQLAYWLGASEVYLMGLDWSYTFDPETAQDDTEANQTVVAPVEGNHAVAGYMRDGETWGIPQMDKTTESMREARKAFDEAGRKIVNISRKSALDVFERGTLEDVL